MKNNHQRRNYNIIMVIIMASVVVYIIFFINKMKNLEMDIKNNIDNTILSLVLENKNKIEEIRQKEKQKTRNMDRIEIIESDESYSYTAKTVSNVLKGGHYNGSQKIVFLTFDDGVSTTVTPKVLDVLDRYDIHATFFLTGESIEIGGKKAQSIVKDLYERGNAIGNHTYSHDYEYLYPGGSFDIEHIKKDIQKNEKLLQGILGKDFTTNVIRCPGGEMSWSNKGEFNEFLENNNLVSIDWNALNFDAQGKKKTASELVDCAIKSSGSKKLIVLLMHDTYKKEETAKALPKIIEYYMENEYEFKVLK